LAKLASIDLSVSQSARVDKSLKFSGLSLSTLKTVRLPIPNKDDVESHIVMACAAGKMLHKTGLRMLQIECTEKGKLKEDHVDLDKLRVRLATLRDACLAKLPPCEATFTQHVLRSSLQINIWMTA
jgi:hypothetical protein